MKSQAFFTETLASVVVFLVALPLCMGIAIASGAPPAAGLLSGMIGGLVVGWLAGSPLQVSGPAAGLAVIVFDIIHTHGIEALGPILAIAGILQMVAGKLKLGQWFRAVAPAVIYAMLAGIGVLIYVIRTWGSNPDGVAYAVLLMNMAVPVIDHFTRPRVYGHD